MFRHQGKSRTLKHNLRIATLLSFVAGLVNVTGFLAFHQLTTNVTGHFALFINDLAHFNMWKGTVYFLYIFAFLAGSFVSGYLIEKFRENQKLNVYVLPTLLESFILLFVPLWSMRAAHISDNVLVCCLLFAMGLQNSFVTKISNAIVRTTHLTGLFTDLGIELSQLLFPKAHPNRAHIFSTLKLRMAIVCCFFLGGISGGYLFSRLHFGLNTLLFGAVILLGGLLFDDFRFRLIRNRRKHIPHKPAV